MPTNNITNARNQIPTIDVNLVTIETPAGEYGFDTANQIEVEAQTDEQDAVRLVVKGRLRAQKPKEVTITGHQITLHDNVFIPELVKTLQGGTIYYYTDATHTDITTEPTDFGFAKYTPPLAGSNDKGEVFGLNAYSAIYNAAGVITGYEKTHYPNCQGVPVAFNSEDGTFRAPEYTINSAPNTGEAPYEISTVSSLPVLIGEYNTEGPGKEITLHTITSSLSNVVSSNSAVSIEDRGAYVTKLTANEGYTVDNVSVSMGGTDITSGAYDAATGNVNISPVTGNIALAASATINTYTITNNLTNATTSNDAASIVHGNAYNATITAESGHTLGDVTVTMGGVDVTSVVATSGVISIASVTGNIVITASAS